MRERGRSTGDRRSGLRRAWMALAALATFLATVLPAATNAEAAFTFVRWSGSTRWTTNVAVSQSTFPNGSSMVVIASGVDFPDALAAAPLAGVAGAPVLLTLRDGLPTAVATELARLGPSEVVIVGGTAAVSDAVATQIEQITDVTPTRIAGGNRYETAAAMATTAFSGASTVYVASGVTFADALAGAAAGGYHRFPVLLTAPGALPAATRDAIAALGQPDVLILGGPNAVSETVELELAAATDGTVRRISGANRYETSVAVSTDAFSPRGAVFLASAHDFPDALSAAAAAATKGVPVLLTQRTCVPAKVLTEIYRHGAGTVVTVGGTDVVGPGAAGLVPCSPPVTPLYSFLATAGNAWVRWNPCRERIYYHVYRSGATTADLAAVPAAVAAIEAASGFDFVFVGYVDDNSWPGNSDAYIGFAPTMEGNVIGEGGFWSIGNEAVNGFVEVLSGLPATERHHALLHELAHMLGLDHVDDPEQVMYPRLTGSPRLEYAHGDREGLRLVGTTMPCLPANLTRGDRQLVTWTDER